MKTFIRIIQAVCPLLCAVSSFGQFNFTQIDAPSSSATWASGISPAGQIVGGYVSSVDKKEHGYVFDGGTFTTIDVPGSLVGVPGTLESEINGINPAGDMVGDYFAPPGAPGAPACVVAYSPPCDRGFLYRKGEFYSILVPGHLGSVPNSITADGSIYGCLHDQKFGAQMFGMVRVHSNVKTLKDGGGEFMTLQAGGGELADSTQWYANSMNNGATPDGSIIVGKYVPPGSSRVHGYIVQNGVLTEYMYPGSQDTPRSLATQIWGINPNGDFVGFYRNTPSDPFHGFVQPGDGSAPIAINFVDPDTGAAATVTEAFGINPAGAIVGVYVDSNGGQHGFLAVPISN